MILVDANVLLDVLHSDPQWGEWSNSQLRNQSRTHELAINSIVYAEISVSFATPAALDTKLADLEVMVLSIPRQAAFLAGKAFVQYRRRGGPKTNVLSDFLIGAHAFVLACPVLTRDTRRYATYFPGVTLIAP
jgi:predicted nucleic acid-binding protein